MPYLLFAPLIIHTIKYKNRDLKDVSVQCELLLIHVLYGKIYAAVIAVGEVA